MTPQLSLLSPKIKPYKMQFMSMRSKRGKSSAIPAGAHNNHQFFFEDRKGSKFQTKNHNDTIFEMNMLKNFPTAAISKTIYRQRKYSTIKNNHENSSNMFLEIFGPIKNNPPLK